MNKLYDKISTSYCRAYVSQHYEGWDPRIFENYDINNYLEVLDSLDSDVVIVTCKNHNGYWFTDLGLGKMLPGLNGVDQLQKSIDYFKDKNKLVMCYFSIVHDEEQYKLHPDWRQVDISGKELGQGSYGKVVCLNSPYREYARFMLRTLFKKRDISGIFLDMASFLAEPCYCEHCQRLFKARYNCEVPQLENYDDPIFLDYIDFRRRSNLTFIKELIDEIKRVKPDALCSVASNILKSHSSTVKGIDITKYCDYIYCDAYSYSGFLQFSVMAKLNRELTALPPEIGIMTRPGDHNDTPNMIPFDHTMHEAMSIISNGGAVHLFDIMWADGSLQKETWKRNAQVFKEIKLRAEWLKGVSKSQVVVLYSENSLVRYAKNRQLDKFVTHIYGICRALTELKIPYDIATNLDGISKYDTLILPNAACLSDSEISKIKKFVVDGGGLICSNKTSLYGSKGEFLGNYGLSEVIGLNYIDETAAYSRVYNQYDLDSPIGRGLIGDGLMTSWGSSPKVETTSGKSVANIVYPYSEPSDYTFINIMANPPAVYTEYPACVINEYGKGKTVYFTGSIEKDYLLLSYPELKQIISNSVKYVLKEELKVQALFNEPAELSVYEKGSSLIIHINNCLLDYGRNYANYGRKQVETRNIVQQVLPINNLKLLVDTDAKKIESIRLQPSNIELKWEEIDNKICITVPQVKYHEMVVINRLP